MLYPIMIAALTPPEAKPCPLPFETVRDETSARAIAKVVIDAAPSKKPDKHIKGYKLVVKFYEGRRSWLIYEAPIAAVEGVHFLGGGGLGMEISACDGAVSDITTQI